MFDRKIGEYDVRFDAQDNCIYIKGPHQGQVGGCVPSFGRNADPMVFVQMMTVEDCDRYCDFFRGTRRIGQYHLTCRGESIAIELRRRFRDSQFGYVKGSNGDYYNQRDAFDAVTESDCESALGIRKRRSILAVLIDWVRCK